MILQALNELYERLAADPATSIPSYGYSRQPIYGCLILKHDGKAYDLGGPKLGIILGDFSQVGCNSVADPGTFLAPYTIVYQLTRINKGFYGPNVLLKNKPIEHGVVEITPLSPLNE